MFELRNLIKCARLKRLYCFPLEKVDLTGSGSVPRRFSKRSRSRRQCHFNQCQQIVESQKKELFKRRNRSSTASRNASSAASGTGPQLQAETRHQLQVEMRHSFKLYKFQLHIQ